MPADMDQALVGTIGHVTVPHHCNPSRRGHAPGTGGARGFRRLLGRADRQARTRRRGRVPIGEVGHRDALRLTRSPSPVPTSWRSPQPRPPHPCGLQCRSSKGSQMFFWHVPAPNEALLISGSRRDGEQTQFRIVTGSRLPRDPGQAEGPHPLAVPARGRDRRGMRDHAGHPAAHPRRRRLQDRRRPGVDRQRCQAFSCRAGPDGGAGRPHLRRPPAVHHRQPHRRGDHPRARPAGPGGQGRQPLRDGEARASWSTRC